MANERLRDALNRTGRAPHDIASEVGVDPKTVERWVSQDRLPYPKHRSRVAAILRQSENYLWPKAMPHDRRAEVSESEVIRIYPRRAEIPRDFWKRLIDTATDRVDLLVYAGLFFPEQQPDLPQILCDKVRDGTPVRLLMGRHDGAELLRRGSEEGIGDAVVSRVRNAMSFYQPHIEHGCMDIRLHDTTLYNSIFRFDDEMLVNSHVYGLPAAHAPVIHLRRLNGGELFTIYQGAFDRVWSSAVPAAQHVQPV
ncbi:MAG: XRE family transcriptional regulator [Acidimicrobiia bacterium]|nr:XRE family transcriptional regulator [Acidimicrobiia bacterium]